MTNEREHALAGTTYEAFNGHFVTVLQLEDTCIDAGSALSENESLAQAAKYYIIDELLPYEEFEARWRKRYPIVGNKAHLFAKPGKTPVAVSAYTPKPHRAREAAIPVPDTLTDETWIAPVQAAKYLGVPPQYVYGKIKQGRLKTQGERPKKVLWGEVRRSYGVS